MHWRYSGVPVATNTFTSADDGATTVKLNARERPQLLLSQDGVPEALFSGASPGPADAWQPAAPPGFTGTFTMVQPVRKR